MDMGLRKQWSNIVKGVCWNCARILTTGGPSFLQQVLTRVQQWYTICNALLFGQTWYTLDQKIESFESFIFYTILFGQKDCFFWGLSFLQHF